MADGQKYPPDGPVQGQDVSKYPPNEHDVVQKGNSGDGRGIVEPDVDRIHDALIIWNRRIRSVDKHSENCKQCKKKLKYGTNEGAPRKQCYIGRRMAEAESAAIKEYLRLGGKLPTS